MRPSQIFLIVLLAASCATPVEHDVLMIREVMEKQVEAWNFGDIPAYMQGYWNDEDLIFTGGKGITYGWQGALDRYLNAYPDQEAMGELSFTDLQIERTSASTAFCIGQWTLHRKTDTLSGRFTLVWQKINGDWLIIADHSS